MTAHGCANVYLTELRRSGCVKIKITDRMLVSRQRQECEKLAARLGNEMNSVYIHPYLYVTLGERLPAGPALAAEGIGLRANAIAALSRNSR